jgi:hypothetical protein
MGLGGCHDKSAPGDSQGNGTAENNNRDIKMGTAAFIAHAGMPLAYWLFLRCHVIALDTIPPLWMAHPLISNDLVQRLGSYPAKSLVMLPCSLQDRLKQESSWDMG